MDNRPIGVFDSGLGGLTAVKKLKELLPFEDIVYFGDTGRVPYGSRSKDTIIKYARQDVSFLLSLDIKAIIVACGTVSTNALDEIKPDCPVPIFGVCEPAARAAAAITENRKIGLIGTEASIRSGAYERLIHTIDDSIEIVSRSCPLLVPLVENGRISPTDAVLCDVARGYLEPIRDAGVDTLILGCTHYPIIAQIIADIMGDGVSLINPGAETALALRSELSMRDMMGDTSRVGSCSYYVSDEVSGFARTASLFLGEDVTGEVRQIAIDLY